MSDERIAGQLYIIKLRARIPITNETVRGQWAVIGSNQEDAVRRFRYFVDLSPYAGADIHVEKAKPACHCVYLTTRSPVEEPDYVTENEEGTTGHMTRTNQASHQNAFAVGVAATLNALDEAHAQRRIGRVLMDMGNGRGTPGALYEGSVIHIEAVGQKSLHTMPHFSDVYPRARFVSGGAIGMGK